MSVPASSERFLAKARDLPVDEVMLDLEDSVAPDAKPAARELAVAALRAGGWAGKLVAVRVNGVTTPWAYRDVIAVAEGLAPGFWTIAALCALAIYFVGIGFLRRHHPG